MADHRRRRGGGRDGRDAGLFPTHYAARGEDDAAIGRADGDLAPPGGAGAGLSAGGVAERAGSEEAGSSERPVGEVAYADDGSAGRVASGGGYADDGYADDGYADDGDADDGYADDGYADDADGLYADDGYADDGYADDGYADDGYADDAEDGDDGYYGPADDGYGAPVAYRMRRRRRRRRHPVLAGLLVALAAAVVVAGLGLVWAIHQIDPGGKPGRKVTVDIPEGASTAAIGSDLAAAGVIHDGSLFRYYVRLEGDGPLLPGRYSLPVNEPYDKAIAALDAGPRIVVDKLVIPEGFTLRQIAARVAALPGLHLSAAKFLAASSDGSVRSKYEPAGVDDLEGLVFPATYAIQVGGTASPAPTEAGIMQLMVQTFDQRMDGLGLAAGAAALHMTPYQVITVASIIEGEAKLDSQRADVASVIYNRLADGMTLGTDSTLVYALRRTDPDINIATINYNQPNPYNTRLHKGLPPTPIDSPSVPSLQAAIHPAKTDDLYFVEVNPDGTLGFASDNAGFAHLQQECMAAKLC